MEQRSDSEQMEAGTGKVRREFGHMEREMAERFENLRNYLGRVNEAAVTFVRRNPGSSLVMAMAAGFLVGRLLRA